MIGWGPIFLTVVAVALLVLVGIDASSGFHATTVAGTSAWVWLHNALNAAIEWLSHFGVQDWVLLGVAVYLLAWAWVRAFAFVRLGSIQIADLTCDDAKLGPVAGKALLQQALGKHGLLPPSGVPSGSPTVASIADAISKAPIAEAGWLAALVGLIPTPRSSTGFMIAGTLLPVPGQSESAVEFSYELSCTGPRPSVHLGTAQGADAAEAIEAAGRDIYRIIGAAAPDLFPSWARWGTSEALTTYHQGLDTERLESDYAKAHDLYMKASALDPDNMLTRLRAANCLERMARSTPNRNLRFELLVRALAAYNSIRVRWPEIFEAGFRASVLMSVLASEPETTLSQNRLLAATVDRYERATAAEANPHAVAEPARDKPLRSRMEGAGLREARRVRHELRPLSILRRYKRLRHRLEPTGRERRQLRKALGISKMAQKARSERTRILQHVPPAGGSERAEQLETAPFNAASEVRQLWWRAVVRWYYLGGRWHVAGWQAHYNAACFYALLPRAERSTRRLRGSRVRKRALAHLAFAVDRAAGALDCAYVRDEDPDLETLRRLNKSRFATVLGRVCPDDLVIRYDAAGAKRTWKVRASGDAVKSGTAEYAWFPAVSVTGHKATFRVRILDENRPVAFAAWCNGRQVKEDPGWEILPAALAVQDITVDLATRKVTDAEGHAVVS